MKIDLHTHILPRDWPDLDARWIVLSERDAKMPAQPHIDPEVRVGLGALAGTNSIPVLDPACLLVTHHSSLATSFV